MAGPRVPFPPAGALYSTTSVFFEMVQLHIIRTEDIGFPNAACQESDDGAAQVGWAAELRAPLSPLKNRILVLPGGGVSERDHVITSQFWSLALQALSFRRTIVFSPRTKSKRALVEETRFLRRELDKTDKARDVVIMPGFHGRL